MAWVSPGARIVIAFGAILALVSSGVDQRRIRALSDRRAGEDIGTFARAFDRRREPFDPHVVRATWDALQPYLTTGGAHAPLRPSDRCVADLHIDGDDLDELLPEIAERVGRSLDALEANPYFGHVESVGDVVRFISAEPRARAA